MDDVRIGVIGCGGRGVVARIAHRPGQGSRLVAGADISGAEREKFGSFCGGDVFLTDDYRALLDRRDVDAVFVMSPDHCHEEHAVSACQAGKHVFLEKPMAISIEGCDRILQAAHDAGVKLYLGHNMRHSPVMLKMKELIDAGSIGRPKVGWCRHFVSYGVCYFRDWHAERSKSTSLLLQKGSHDIDILHWLCGGYSKRVTAMGGLTLYDQTTDRHGVGEPRDASWDRENWPPLSQKGLNPVIDVEDVSMMLMELDNGVFASYQQCHYSPDDWRNFTIIGTEGRIENFGTGGRSTVVRLWDKRHSYMPQGDAEFNVVLGAGGFEAIDVEIVTEFIRYIREGGDVATSPIAARYSVAAGYQAAVSLRNQSQPQDVPDVTPEIRAYFDGPPSPANIVPR